MYINDDEMEDDLTPYSKISNREPLENPNDQSSMIKSRVIDDIRAKQAQSSGIANIGQAMDAFSRGVNAPQANTQLYKNIQDQGENVIKYAQDDANKQAKITQMIAQNQRQDKQHAENMAFNQKKLDSNEALRLATIEAAKAKQESKLPPEVQNSLNAASTKSLGKVLTSNQLKSVYEKLNDPNISEDQKIMQANQAIKTMNSTEGADAVGSEEVARLASYLQRGPNWQKGMKWSPDVKAFADQLGYTIQTLDSAVEKNNETLAKVKSGEPGTSKFNPKFNSQKSMMNDANASDRQYQNGDQKTQNGHVYTYNNGKWE